MIVVDTSVWIGYFNGVATRETAPLGVEPFVIGDLILAEVLQGFRAEGDARKARTALDRLLCQPMVGRDVALASARNYRALRAGGVTVRKTIDMLIATFCLENGHLLLHADRDFVPIIEHLGLETL